MTWVEFKDFLWKNLGNSRAFVDSIWKKVKRDSQYQNESVQDWAAYLKYLQFILIEFDSKCAPKEAIMIRYFPKGLCPSIRMKMKQYGRELDNFEELVKKTINVEAKAALRPRSYARKTDQHCFWSSWPSIAKASTQSQSMKDPRFEKPKSKPQESKALARQRSDNAETSKKGRKEKKKNDLKHWRSCWSDNESFRATAATGSNTTNNSAGGSQTQKDISQIIYYNCNKKGPYATKYPEPSKSKN